jgi:hypothetical protein
MRAEDVDVAASVSRGRLVLRAPWRSVFDDYVLAAAFGLPAGFVWVGERGDGAPGRVGVFALASLCLGAYLAWSSYASYRLRVVTVDGDREQVIAKTLDAVHALGWSIDHRDEQLIKARTPPSPLTWGQEVTIIPEAGRLHFNSRNATARRLVYQISFGRNGWNYRQFCACVERAASPRENSLFSSAIGPREVDYVRTPEHIGCALGLLPVIALLVLLVRYGLKEATLPVRAPSYPGEVVPSMGLGGISVVAVFLSFFLAVFTKFALGIVAGRAVSILSLPLTLGFFALYALIVLSTGIFPDQVSTLLLMATIAGGAAVLLGLWSSAKRGA